MVSLLTYRCLFEMTRSFNRVNTVRLSLSMCFTLSSVELINDALTSRGLQCLLTVKKLDETLILLDKLTESALRLSFRDSNVSSISCAEDRFSTMFSSLCNLFDNPNVMNRKARIVKDLTDQIKYTDKKEVS